MAKKAKNTKVSRPVEEKDGLDHEFFDSAEHPESGEIDDAMIRSFRPRWRRNPYVAVVIIPLTIFLMYMLSLDFLYGVKGLFSKKPKELGEITRAISEGRLKRNTYVTVRGTPFVQSIIPVPKKGKRGAKPTNFYLYYLLQGTDNAVIVKLLSDKPQFVGEIPGVHTGRLLRLRDVTEGKRIQAYVQNDRNNRVDQDILFNPTPWSDSDTRKQELYRKNLEALRRGGGAFVTDLQRGVAARPDFKVDIKAHFLPDIFISFNRKKEVFSSITLIGGTFSNESCDKGLGGDVVLLRDSDTFTLPQAGIITGTTKDGGEKAARCDYAAIWTGKPSTVKGKIGFEPKKEASLGKPLVPIRLSSKTIRIPSDATVTDAATGKELTFTDGKYVVRGARAGEKPVTVKVKLSHSPFAHIEGCYHWLSSRGYPFAKVGALGDLGDGNWELVARIPDADLQALRAKNRIVKKCEEKKDAAGPPRVCTFIYPSILVKPRELFIYNVKYKDIKVQGDDLVVLNARANFPKKYQVSQSSEIPRGALSEGGSVKMLLAEKPQPEYRLPLTHINKFKFYPTTEVPDDAWIIVSDEPPGKWKFLWKIPVVLVLFALMIFNFSTVVRHFIGKKA